MKKNIDYRVLCSLIRDDIDKFRSDICSLKIAQRDEHNVEVYVERSELIEGLESSIVKAEKIILKHKQEHPEYFI